MKKMILGSLTALMLFSFAASSSANVIQIWSCKLKPGKTTAELETHSSAWLKAARSMKGGKDLEVFLDFPLAAPAGEGEFQFVLIAADTKTWGLFNNDYGDSAAAKADAKWNDVASCSNSELWESNQVK
jgi:hypothetical protein